MYCSDTTDKRSCLKLLISSESSDWICFFSFCLTFYRKHCVLPWFFSSHQKFCLGHQEKRQLCIWWNMKGRFLWQGDASRILIVLFNDPILVIFFPNSMCSIIFTYKVRLGHYHLLAISLSQQGRTVDAYRPLDFGSQTQNNFLCGRHVLHR